MANISPGPGTSSSTTTTNNYTTTATPTDYASTEFPATKSGSLFLAGSGQLNLALLGYLRMTIQNPAGSGVNMYIREIDLYSSNTTPSYAHLWVNPTAGLPATPARPIVCTNVGGASNAAPLAIVKVDLITQVATTPLSGGTDTGIDIGFGGSVQSQVTFPPIILNPGSTLGIASSILASTNISIVARWIEKVVGT